MEKFYTLVNPANGNLLLKVLSFESNSHFDHLQRFNYYTAILIEEGTAKLKTDFSEYEIAAGDMLFFSPYQPFMICTDMPIKGTAINFHTEFFCLHRHIKEISCEGLLFSNVYEKPFINIKPQDRDGLLTIINWMKEEINKQALAQHEILISFLKILFINASRIKIKLRDFITLDSPDPPVIQLLKDAIEENYKQKHAPSDYAKLLDLDLKALGRVVKKHFNKTLTNLIAERLVIEAKRELYLTQKTVKEIAYDLGFNDEYYFSRFFKTNADIAPLAYRQNLWGTG